MRRYLETFFRYWLIVIMPVIVLSAGEYVLVRHTPRTIVTSMNILVQDSVNGAAVDGSPWNTPAQNQAANLAQWQQSPSFNLAVAMGSPSYAKILAKSADPTGVASNDLSTHIAITAKGYRLVNIAYTTVVNRWLLSEEVVNSFVSTARNRLLSLQKQQAAAGVQYYTSQLHDALAQERASAQKLADYMSKQGISADQLVVQLPDDPTLANLYQQNQTNQSNVTTIQQKLSSYSAQLTSPGSATDQAGLMTIDSPSTTLVSNTKTVVSDLGIAFAVGLLLAILFVVVKTALDRTVRFADEVPDLFDLPVLAVLTYDPDLNRKSLASPKNAEVRAKRRLIGLRRTG